MVARNLKIPVEKVIRNIDRFGNTTATSIPIPLDEALKEGRRYCGPHSLRFWLHMGISSYQVLK